MDDILGIITTKYNMRLMKPPSKYLKRENRAKEGINYVSIISIMKHPKKTKITKSEICLDC